MRFSGLKMFAQRRCCRSKTGEPPSTPSPSGSGIAKQTELPLRRLQSRQNCFSPTASACEADGIAPPPYAYCKADRIASRQLQALAKQIQFTLCKQRIPRLQTVNKLFYKHIFCICHKVCVFEINNPYFSIILNKIITRNILINNMMLM